METEACVADELEDTVSTAFYAELYDAVEMYALATHLFWCVFHEFACHSSLVLTLL